MSPVNYDYDKIFGDFVIRIRDILTVGQRWEWKIFFDLPIPGENLVKLWEGRSPTLKEAKKKALKRLWYITRDAQVAIDATASQQKE